MFLTNHQMIGNKWQWARVCPCSWRRPVSGRAQNSNTSAAIKVGEDLVWRRCDRLHDPKLFRHRCSAGRNFPRRHTRPLHTHNRLRQHPYRLPRRLAEAVEDRRPVRSQLALLSSSIRAQKPPLGLAQRRFLTHYTLAGCRSAIDLILAAGS